LAIKRNRIQRACMALLFAIVVSLGGAILLPQVAYFFAPQPVLAQLLRTDDVWRSVYQRIPDLPLENQYVSRETGKVESNNTLIGRLIRYHVYLKGRPPFYRLDWKITMADYLGVNGAIEDGTYPSHETLRRNPLEGDIAAIKQLNSNQRNALIQALVDAFTPQRAEGKR
jgi:hypothetical protein